MADATMTLQVEDPLTAALPWVRFLSLQGSGNGITFNSLETPERFSVTQLGVFDLIFNAATGVSFPEAPSISSTAPPASNAVVLSSFGSSSFTLTVTVTNQTPRQTVSFTINTTGGPIDPSIAIDPPGGVDGDPKEPR